MGSFVEINDTLQITKEQGFPAEVLDLEKHKKKSIKLSDLKTKVFEFHDKENPRLYHVPPTRLFLVHNIDGKWLYWGHVLMLSQTITCKNGKCLTSGKYEIIKLYDPAHQLSMTKNESPEGKSYF